LFVNSTQTYIVQPNMANFTRL